MWLAKASSIEAKFAILTCKNYASYVKCEIPLPCSINRKQHGFFGVFWINTGSWYFKTPQISLAAAAARDILMNFEISLAVFIPNTPRNRAIFYTNTTLILFVAALSCICEGMRRKLSIMRNQILNYVTCRRTKPQLWSSRFRLTCSATRGASDAWKWPQHQT